MVRKLIEKQKKLLEKVNLFTEGENVCMGYAENLKDLSLTDLNTREHLRQVI